MQNIVDTCKTLGHFHTLCQIPRGSGNEKAVSDWIYGWAKERRLEVQQDTFFNLSIRKPASKGCESLPPLLLQAHLDMVCDKTPESDHDFSKDPIPWQIDGDWISSASGTSLGADCGVGVALILTALESDWVHPPLEVLLTTREETDMTGAYAADLSFFSAQRMINLDISPDSRLLAGSCGGVAVELKLPLTRKSIGIESELFCIRLSGLQGGHSGADIDKGRGNAILLLGRILLELKDTLPLSLVSFSGGNSRLAIPRESQAIVAVSSHDASHLIKCCETLYERFSDECKDASPDFVLNCTPAAATGQRPLTESSAERLLDACLLFPDGIQQMNPLMTGAVESSANLGILEIQNFCANFICEVRATYDTTRQTLVDKQARLAKRLGGEIRTHSEYPAWRYQSVSSLRKSILEIYKKRENRDMDVYAAHAGNEIGILASRIPQLDAVAIGPTRVFFHSPKERLSISSTLQFEDFLRDILYRLASC